MLTSAAKASRATGIPYDTLCRLLREGVIPSVKIPGRLKPLVDLADVEAFIQASKTGESSNEYQALHAPPKRADPVFVRDKQGKRVPFWRSAFEKGA